jgi:predicted porin
MKKSLIALAVMAAAGAASAQSSVTLFGIVDASVSRYFQSGSATVPGSHNTVLTNSGYNSSRLGFRGTEDLGGGMSASFWLEGALSNDDGTVGKFDFRRRSTVSLAGGWGELRLGRDYVPTFWNITVFDPFGTNGVGQALVHKVKLMNNPGQFNFTALDPNYVRASNMIGYFLPANLGGIYGQVNYAFDEVSGSDTRTGRYVGGRLGYGSGPFNVAIAYGATEGTRVLGLGPVGTVATNTPDVRDWNIGGQWDFGMAKLMGSYDRAKYEGGPVDGDFTLKTWLIGALVPVGAGEIRVSYSRAKAEDDFRANQWAVGYVHNLSKRTALYATYARLSNRNDVAVPVGAGLGGAAGVNAAPGQSGWGYDLGIRHSF